MSENKPEIGSVTWMDLTVPNAEDVKDFYRKVVGWKSSPVKMGDYDDFTMLTPENGNGVAGICHAKGPNVGLPSQWLIYITVENVDRSAKLCLEQGGKLLVEPKQIENYGRFCVIEDPAGAIAALYQPA